MGCYLCKFVRTEFCADPSPDAIAPEITSTTVPVPPVSKPSALADSDDDICSGNSALKRRRRNEVDSPGSMEQSQSRVIAEAGTEAEYAVEEPGPASIVTDKQALNIAAEATASTVKDCFAAEKNTAAGEEKACLAANNTAAGEENARLVADKTAVEEIARLAAEKTAAEEKACLAAEKTAAEEIARLAAEETAAGEKARLAAETTAVAEEKARLAAEETAVAEEKARLAAEEAAAEERRDVQARLAAEDATAATRERARQAAAAASSTEAIVAAAIAAELAVIAAASARAAAPYDASSVLLTEGLMADLATPATDAAAAGTACGWLSKKGAAGLAPTFQKHWIVLKRGWMMYFNSDASRASGAKPNSSNYVCLAAYRLKVAEPHSTITLEPLLSTPGHERVWELQRHAATDRAVAQWVAAFAHHGAVVQADEDEAASTAAAAAAAAAVAPFALATSAQLERARAVGPPSGDPPADAGAAAAAVAATAGRAAYKYQNDPSIWLTKLSLAGYTYYVHVPSCVAQWAVPQSRSSEAAAVAFLTAQASASGGEGMTV